MRVLLQLFAAPAVALLAMWFAGQFDPMVTVGAALASQAVAYPCWQRLYRRGMVAALRRRHERGVVLLRGRSSRGEVAAQLALRAASALLLAVALLAIGRNP